MKSFFAELRRRHVLRVALAYLVVAWLVIQIVTNLMSLLDVPVWVGKAILIALVAGFPVSLVIAWAFELTPAGLRRTPDKHHAEPPVRAAGSGWNALVIGAMVLVISYSSDWLFTPKQARQIVDALLANDQDVWYSEINSPYGHDAFLVEVEKLARIVSGFLSGVPQEVAA